MVHDGKLARQVDFIGRTVRYEYDDRNRLIRVTGPAVNACHGSGDCFPNGKTLAYGYESNEERTEPRYSFQLETVTLPREQAGNGTPRLRNRYGDDGKLERQVWGQSGTQEISFDYNQAVTTVTDRRGNPTAYTHNAFGHAETAVEVGSDLPTFTTQFAYEHPDGLLTRLTLPEGNTVQHSYDQNAASRRAQGNLLRTTRQAGSRPTGGSNGTLTTRNEDYQLLHNLVGRRVDAGGFPTTFEYDDNGNLRFTRRPEGITEEKIYNAFGQVIRSSDGEGNQSRYDYHPESRPDGVHTTPTNPLRQLAGGTGGYLAQVVVNETNGGNQGVGGGPSRPPTNLATTYLYDSHGGGKPDIGYIGLVTAVVNPRGVRTEYGVNELGQVFRQILATTPGDGGEAPALNFERRVYFDGNGQVTRKDIQHDAGGRFTVYEFTYDLLDNLRSQTVESGGQNGNQTLRTGYDYDPNQNLSGVTQPEGNRTAYAYNSRDQVKAITRGEGASGASTATFEYDGNRNVTTSRDGRGDATVIAYDGFDRRLSVTDRLGNRNTFSYDDNGLLRQMQVFGPRGGQGLNPVAGNDLLRDEQYDYDQVYRRTAVNQAIIGEPAEGRGGDGVKTTRYDYDRNSRVIQVSDDNNHALLSYYDGANRLIATRDALNNETEFFHDGSGNVIRTVEREQPAGMFESAAAYDALDRQVRSVDPIGNVRRMAYDAQNNVTTTVDAENNVIRTVYDLLNRREITFQDLKSGGTITTSYDWDRNSRQRFLRDDNGNTTSYDYDALDRVVTTTYPDNTVSRVQQYDANDNPLTVRDQNGTTQTLTYDANDRLVQRQVAKSSAVLGNFDAILEQYEYDGLSRLTRAVDEDADVGQVYDSLDRITAETTIWRLDGISRTVGNRFDGVGNRTRLLYPSGITAEYRYDALNRVQDILHPASPRSDRIIASYAYTGPERVRSRTYGNGVTLELGFDLNRRINRLTHQGAPGTGGGRRPASFDFRYAWTPEDQRAGEQRMHEGGRVDLYVYDHSTGQKLSN